MLRNENNVLNVTENNLCIGCGTCLAFCPSNAIKMKINPVTGNYCAIPTKDCNHCGLCLDICPGYEINFELLNQKIFKKKSNDILLGNFTSSCIGHTTDKQILFSSSSGGLVTTLLIYLLETKRIDGALILKKDLKNPLKPMPFIATSKEEIMQSMGSRYCPVPTNTSLKNILNSNFKKLAVVGLPCQIAGLRKTELIFDGLKQKIFIHIGLFCNNLPSFNATRYILEKFDVANENVISIDYRGSGWPGYLKIVLKNNQKSIIVPFFEYWNSGFGQFFPGKRCRLCVDQTNELADISFGDGWIPTIMKENSAGVSLFLIRQAFVDELLSEMMEKKLVKIKPIISSLAVQDAAIFRKAGHLLWLTSNDVNMPKFKTRLLAPNLKVIIFFFYLRFGSFLADFPKLWKFVNIYAKTYNIILSFSMHVKSIFFKILNVVE